MNRSRRPLSALLLVAFLLGPTGARAQPASSAASPAAPAASPGSSARAADLKQRGDAAMDALRYDEALADYAQAYDATHDPALLYNQGRALQALGRYPEALAAIERFAKEAPPALRARVPKLDDLVAELRAHVARVSIRCEVQGARVLVRDKVVGTTPLAGPIEVESGKATIEIDAEGFEPYRRDVDLTGGALVALEAQLSPRATSAVLRVSSTAASATVLVDGKPAGNAPVEIVIAPGSHAIAVRREGYEDVESTVVIQPGEHKDVTLEPQKNAPITSKWWFWTGVGVVVAGGVATTVALLKSKPASNGDGFSPSQVGAPLVRF
jgi:hypothetical protein